MEDVFTVEKVGWIQDPVSKLIVKFHRDQDSWEKYPYVFVDQGSLMDDGSPALLKSRRHLAMREAIEVWNAFLHDGWRIVLPQW